MVPFPLAKRRDMIERHARRMTDMRPDKAEAHLQRLLVQLGEKLIGYGCDEAAVAIQIAQAEVIIRDRYRVVRAIANSDEAGA